MQKNTNNRWKLCKDGMPKEKTHILICTEEGDMNVSIYDPERYGALDSPDDFKETRAFQMFWYRNGSPVTAWRPLPAPYDPVAKNNNPADIANGWAGWISCDEQMPDKKIKVLICNKKGEMCNTWYLPYSTDTGKFKKFLHIIGNIETVAWQPLPEPFVLEKIVEEQFIEEESERT